MTLTINGVDFMPYTFREGFKWQHSDIDASDAGRTMDGTMIRARVTSKVRLDITCRPLTLQECSIVLTAIEPEWLTVTYTDPMQGRDVTKTMYSNNRPAAFAVKHKDGTEWWNGITFPLVEQ